MTDVNGQCEYGCEDGHEPECDQSFLEITKGQFVDGAEANVRAAFEGFTTLVKMGIPAPSAIEQVVEEAREAAVCFTGRCRH